MEFFLYFPQVRCSVDDVVARARAAEQAGFTGIAFMDHLATPMAESQPMFEAMTLATWVAAQTERLIIGHLVLCDALRHPAVLARQAATLNHASRGRFELGLGWGSVGAELVANGVTDDLPPQRLDRLSQSLDVIRGLWTGQRVTFEGTRFQLRDALAVPAPLTPIPIVIGGAGQGTLRLARNHADWWNLPAPELHRIDDLRGQVGTARVSTQNLVRMISDGENREDAEHRVRVRFPGFGDGVTVGDADTLAAYFESLARTGVERCYVWFADGAPTATIEAFGSSVISQFRADSANADSKPGAPQPTT